MAAVNLAPTNPYEALARRRRRTVLSATAILIVLLLAVWGGIFIWQTSVNTRLTNTQQRLSAVETEIANLQVVADRIVLFEKRLTDLNALLSRHILPNRLLLEVERTLPAGTVLTALSSNLTEGALQMTGRAASVDEIAQTIASLKNRADRPTFFVTTDLLSANRREEGATATTPGAVFYTFDSRLTFDPAKLRSK